MRRLAGFRITGDEVPLTGNSIVIDGRALGFITSATGSPSLGYPIAIGFIDREASRPGTRIEIDCGGRALAAEVVSMPFFDPERRLSNA